MLKALSLVASGRILSTASQALTLLLMARHLGPSDFAEFAAVLGALMALSLVADGGATYAVGRHHLSDPMIANIFRASRLMSIATLVISFPVLAAFVVNSNSPILIACIPLCAWLPLERQLEVTSAYLMSKGDQGVVGVGYLLRRVPTLVAILIVPSENLVWAFSVTMLVSAAAANLLLGRHVSVDTRGMIPDRATWSVLRPFWAAIAGQGVRQVDVAVLTFAAGPLVAGIYAPATRLVPALLLVPGTYTQLLLARIAATKEELTTRAVLILGAVTAAVFAPLAITAKYWVPLLLGDAYAESVAVCQIVIASLVFAAMSSAFASGLHATDRASRVASVVWFCSTATIALIAVLGSSSGAVGAAWAVAFGYALQFFMMAFAYRLMPQRAPALAN